MRARAGAFSDKEIALAADFRRPGRDRDRERAAVQRDQGGARAADRNGRRAAGHQRVDSRPAAGVRAHLAKCRGPVRRRHSRRVRHRRRRHAAMPGHPRQLGGTDQGAVPDSDRRLRHGAGHRARPCRQLRRCAERPGRAGRAAQAGAVDRTQLFAGTGADDLAGPRHRRGQCRALSTCGPSRPRNAACWRPSPTRR